MAKQKQLKSKRAGGKDVPLDFESALAEVEMIVTKLESGESGLTESLEQYEIGINRLKECHSLLSEAERKISVLSGFDADGNPVTETFETDGDESLQEKQAARSGRRSSGGDSKPRKKPAKEAEDDSGVDGSPGLF